MLSAFVNSKESLSEFRKRAMSQSIRLVNVEIMFDHYTHQMPVAVYTHNCSINSAYKNIKLLN